MPENASYYGGFSAGAKLYAVSGDFTKCDPCSAPVVSYPLSGDTFPSVKDIILLDSTGAYVAVPLGSGYNVQPFAANQTAFVIEQEFMVAEQYYVPMPLNTHYNESWGVGWSNAYVALGAAFLVEEGPLEPVGGGIVKLKRKFANLPSTRNVVESYAYTFPALSFSDGSLVRESKTAIVASRVQYDFYVYDDLELLPEFSVFPYGKRLNLSTGLTPAGLILPDMRYYKAPTALTTTPLPNTVEYNLQISGDEYLRDSYTIGTEIGTTIPSSTNYASWIGKKEIVVEASSLSPWMGNIMVRKTRFATAQ